MNKDTKYINKEKGQLQSTHSPQGKQKAFRVQDKSVRFSSRKSPGGVYENREKKR